MKNKAIKTKLLTVLLALCMVLSLVPMTAFAADPATETADFTASSASTEQCSLWAGRPPRASTTSLLVMARASSTVLPLIISVAMELEAMALPQPKVSNTTTTAITSPTTRANSPPATTAKPAAWCETQKRSQKFPHTSVCGNFLADAFMACVFSCQPAKRAAILTLLRGR